MLLGTHTKALDFRPSAAKASRRLVAEALGSWGLDLDVGVVEACTSELVTNALRHGKSPLHLVIQHWTDSVHIIVIDGSEEHQRRPTSGPYGELPIRQRIVQGLAASWGVEHVPAGTAAWFDVDTDPTSNAPSKSAGATNGAAIAGAGWLLPRAKPSTPGEESLSSTPPR
jgi:hypothetical protein